MLTQRSRYALRAMIFSAEAPPGGPPIPMNRIAAEANVPRKFLELILATLREAGFLHSHRRKMGGYCLSRPTYLISLGEIIRVIEGPRAVPWSARTAYRPCRECKDEASCASAMRWRLFVTARRAATTAPQPGGFAGRGSGAA